jgi:hypothetical protein
MRGRREGASNRPPCSLRCRDAPHRDAPQSCHARACAVAFLLPSLPLPVARVSLALLLWCACGALRRRRRLPNVCGGACRPRRRVTVCEHPPIRVDIRRQWTVAACGCSPTGQPPKKGQEWCVAARGACCCCCNEARDARGARACHHQARANTHTRGAAAARVATKRAQTHTHSRANDGLGDPPQLSDGSDSVRAGGSKTKRRRTGDLLRRKLDATLEIEDGDPGAPVPALYESPRFSADDARETSDGGGECVPHFTTRPTGPDSGASVGLPLTVRRGAGAGILIAY